MRSCKTRDGWMPRLPAADLSRICVRQKKEMEGPRKIRQRFQAVFVYEILYERTNAEWHWPRLHMVYDTSKPLSGHDAEED